jgi:hypothetical protein
LPFLEVIFPLVLLSTVWFEMAMLGMEAWGHLHTIGWQERLASGCPSGTAGTQDIQIDWITVENPA